MKENEKIDHLVHSFYTCKNEDNDTFENAYL